MVFEIRNPFKRSVANRTDNFKNTFGKILGKLSGLNLQATQEIAEKRGQITKLEIEADGLERLRDQNNAMIADVSQILGDNPNSTPTPPSNSEGDKPEMRLRANG